MIMVCSVNLSITGENKFGMVQSNRQLIYQSGSTSFGNEPGQEQLTTTIKGSEFGETHVYSQVQGLAIFLEAGK